MPARGVRHRQTPSQDLPVGYAHQAAALAFARHNARRNGCQQARFQLMDWRYPTLRRRYDYILASDVIYEARNFGPLAAIFGRPHGEDQRCPARF